MFFLARAVLTGVVLICISLMISCVEHLFVCHEIKRRYLLERKVMTNLESIFKSRDITLSTKVHLVKLQFFQWSCMDVRVGL